MKTLVCRLEERIRAWILRPWMRSLALAHDRRREVKASSLSRPRAGGIQNGLHHFRVLGNCYPFGRKKKRMSCNRVPGGGCQGPDVRLIDRGSHVILDNGIVEVTISRPGGIVTGIRFGGIDNLLEIHNKETNRGYWDLNWNEPGGKDTFDVPSGTIFQVVCSDGDKVELSFLRPYIPGTKMLPLNIDKRFVLLRGNTGFYTYGIYERPAGWPDFNLNQTRVTFKLRKDRFQFMAMADTKQRPMPSPDDRLQQHCTQLAYPEAVLIHTSQNPEFRGEVDDKYQYSCDNRENRVHGWISCNPALGFWIITASDEFRNGGPLKQNLTSHVGPTCLAMFHSAHYAGAALCPEFRNGEAWTKVFGPVFIYLNVAATYAQVNCRYLWEDAKQQMVTEVGSWPVPWPVSPDFPKSMDRGSISGRLLVKDSFKSPTPFAGCYAFLGLASPGDKGSWQTESKGYQFWAQADAEGYFHVKHVRAGKYNLYGWVPGVLGDYKKEGSIDVYPGSWLQLGHMVYEPPRDGPTVWEIGIPDRTAAEFHIPDPNPKYINRLFVNHSERYRHYGLWERYSELYPEGDLVFTIGKSDWRSDWFFAHTCRIEKDGSVKPSTWQIRFHLPCVQGGVYKLRLAFAASNNAAIQVRVNDPNTRTTVFDTMQFGKDNAIARHGIHGLYHLWNVDVRSELFRAGENILYLTQRKPTVPIVGVMYDYIRLEAPGECRYES
ncbi:LOW QUALITY PROTEIN: uncharacterized protein LOC9660828 [Selaginella moellendorffii]|uniref:LOW QUALITY PROTEIN: uncharacterized protein LOC9660828 n=1 Tax=Selaginella moellendorffii TaxID=88036 RepID=UPI000D1C6C63|nr:LOW QUALITY PROTEIN: uncharacterized protein LOC9660828 [Selaginella moellendorffii]|eukprot:XP_024518293.1 LOW QUALITY PROTEIN: uncharacterized protein LOC9660828 [Selaginella moellendorffii]